MKLYSVLVQEALGLADYLRQEKILKNHKEQGLILINLWEGLHLHRNL